MAKLVNIPRDTNKTKKQDIQAIVHRFRDAGWTHVPLRTAYAQTIMVSPDSDKRYVMKIASDCGWMNFIAWAAEPAQQASPHLPKIAAIRQFRYRNGDGFVCCVMERLESASGFDPDNHDYDPVLFGGDGDPQRRRRALARALFACSNEPRQLTKQDASLPKTLIKIYNKMVKALGRPNDLHYGNMMLRGETVVLLDPYAPYA